MTEILANLHAVRHARTQLQRFTENNDWAGFEPYDLLNSPYLKGNWTQASIPAAAIIQFGRRYAGLRVRRWLRLPASHNPKALGLFLAAYCDLDNATDAFSSQRSRLKQLLQSLKDPTEPFYCWGYDWDFVSLRGSVLRKFSANCIATCFCAQALLDAGESFGDEEAIGMAESAGQFLVSRLNRSVETPQQVCFSYTPENRTRIFNNSVLAGALLSRLGARNRNLEYLDLARRTMQHLVNHQRADGSWAYGEGRWQQWIDGFHTGYNLCGLLAYADITGDHTFDQALDRGYDFYKRHLICGDGVPKYYHNRIYPVDIHACSQAILTFCAFRHRDQEALALAQRSAIWTIHNMRSPEGAFFYQRHRFWANRTPYMRWGQAWMFRALARLERILAAAAPQIQKDQGAVYPDLKVQTV